MNLLYRNLVILTIATWQSVAAAATLNGELEGDRVRWTNGQETGSYITLSNWKPMSGLKPTSEWVPGTFLLPPTTNLILTGPGGDVNVSMTVAGLEYELGQASEKFTTRGTPLAALGQCTTSQQVGSLAKVYGESCVAGESYRTSSTGVLHTPFQFVRPILQLDSTELVQAFRDAQVAGGVYTGMIPINPVYYFKSPTGTWTYQQASVPMMVSISYIPASLDHVQVSGMGVIEPQYDTVNHQVSGETFFDITATGVFPQGVNLSLDNKVYEMDFETDEVRSIPYSISCVGGCNDSELVKEGIPSVLETSVIGGENTVSFQLRVHYDNITAAEVETGQYRGEFVIYIEESL